MSDADARRPDPPGVELLEPIVRTNLNEVWKARSRTDGAPLVVKFAASAAGPEMLKLEADTVAVLRRAGVMGVIPAEYRDAPEPHLVLPWKGARTLRDAVDAVRSGDARSRTLETFLRLVDIVARVHHAGYLHGDLKPENVILDDDGLPWLTDFGMARVIRAARLDSRIRDSMSRTEGGWGGTLHYLPPEGLHGEAPERSWDVYALGVVLHEILLGSRPDRAATPEHLQTLLPADVVRLLLDALAYSAPDRLGTAGEFLRRLRAVESELTATGPWRWFHRGKRLALAGLAAFFVALRYGTVAALLASYLLFAGLAFTQPAWIFAYIPFALLHFTIRWEGPETAQEAALRRSGDVMDGS